MLHKLLFWLLLLPAAQLIFAPGQPAPAWAGQHCGAKGDWRSSLVPDQWPPKGAKIPRLPGGRAFRPVPVYKACIKHDNCYDTPGAAQKQCDKKFLKDMRRECGRVYKNALDIAQREACYLSAHGYYQAVAKYGAPAFAAAQAKSKSHAKAKRAKAKAKAKPQAKPKTRAKTQSPGKTPAQQSAQAGSPFQAQNKDNPLKWRLWGKLDGVSAVAAAHGILFAYKASSSEVFSSPIARPVWKRLGVAPIGKYLAAGQGNLYLAGVLGAEIWTARASSMKWKPMGAAPQAAAMTLSGAKLFYWQSPPGKILASSIWKAAWKPVASLETVAALAGNAGKVYRLSGPRLEVSVSNDGKPPWTVLGRALGLGSLAADRNQLFLAAASTGEIFSCALP